MRILRDNTGVSIGMDAKKDLPVDMGEKFPVPGTLWQEGTKASTVLPRWECSIAVSVVTARYGAVLNNRGGMMRGVSETGVLRRYGEGVLGDTGAGGG